MTKLYKIAYFGLSQTKFFKIYTKPLNKEMKKNINLNFKHLVAIMIIGFIGLNFGCNKDFESALPKSFKNDTAGLGSNNKKVLYIVLDGVKGAVVNALAPPNLTQITKNAIYSYDGLADYQRNPITNASAWTTMLTGVDNTVHNVTDENFTNINLQVAPTIFSRIKAGIDNVRMVSFGASAAFNDNLAKDATVKQSFPNDDAAVKTAVVNELNTNDPSILVAQFHSAETAGSANGYTTSTATYTSAITTLDAYVGEILTALRARKTFSGENWLVVVASNKGGGLSGGAPGSNIYDDTSRNTFVTFYNPKFKTVAYNMPNLNGLPFSGFAPRFNATATLAATASLSNTSVGNFGLSGGFTLMFKYRDDRSASGGFPNLLSKKNGTTGGYWALFVGSNNVQFDYSATKITLTKDLRDGKWHSIAFTIFNQGAVRKMDLFLDGVKEGTITITGKNADNNFPLKIGPDVGGITNFLIRDIALFNVSMSDADIITKMRKQLQPSDPLYGSLLTYCSGNESSGSQMGDLSGNGNSFNYDSRVQITSFADISPNISPEISSSAFLAVPNGVDIPVLIYNWMNIAVPSQWNLMGKLYLPELSLSTK